MAKVSNTMATKVSLDMVEASTAVKNLTTLVNSHTQAWKAQTAALQSAGDYVGAAKAKYEGLGNAISAQREKLEALEHKQSEMNNIDKKTADQYMELRSKLNQYRSEMDKLDTTTAKGEARSKDLAEQIAKTKEQLNGLDTGTVKSAEQFLKYGQQVDRAKAKLASLQAQQQRAAQQIDVENSGVIRLTASMRTQAALATATAERLRSEGKSYQALETDLNGTRQRLKSLQAIQQREISLLNQTKERFGETSEEYAKQATEVQKLGTQISETRQRINELDGQLGKEPTAWNYVRNSILGVDSAEKRAKDSAINFGTVLKANIFGGWIQTGFSTLTTQFQSIITNGTQAAQVGAAMEARWKNIGVSAGGIKQLSNQVTDLKTNTNLTAQSVNALQTRFYGMTHSISQTRTLTQGVASLSDQLKLSDQQANAFAGGLSRVESSGKVTSSSLGRLEKQAPGLTAALSKASGMSQASFKALVSSGKMTSDQFNQLLDKASKDYDQNSKAFGQSSGGALHKLQQEWKTTQAKLAKPLLKVSATGLNELSNALNNQQTQRGLQILAKGLADSAVNAAKFIGFLAQHQNTVKVFAGALLGLGVAFKGMQAALVAKDTISGFINMVGKIPRLHTTKISVNEANSTKDLQNFSRRVDRIPRSKTTTVRANTTAATNNIQKVGTTARIASTTSKLSFATIGTAAKTAGTTISLAFRANPLGMIVTGVQLAIAAFQLLYQHSAKFRKFTNGIASGAMKAGKVLVSGIGGAVTKSISFVKNNWKEIGLYLVNPVAGAINSLYKHNAKFRKFTNDIVNSAKSMAGKAGRWFGNMAQSAGKYINNMARSAKRGWNQMNRTSQQSSQREIRLHNQMAQRNQRAAQQMWSRLSRSWLQGWNLNNRLTRQGVQQQIQQHRTMSTRIAVFNTQLWNRSRQAFTKGWNDLRNSTRNGTNNINNEFNQMKVAVGQRAQQAMEDAKNRFQRGYSDIKSNTSGWRGDMANIWSDTRGKIGNIADNLRGDATNKFADMHSKLNDLTDNGLGRMQDAWHNRLEGIAEVVTNSGGHIFNQFKNVLNNLAKPFESLINGIKDGVNWVLDHVGGDGKLGSFSFPGFANGTNGPIEKDQLALLNDAPSSHYQEMVHRGSTGETFMLPAKRNMLFPLQKGDEVLDGERSHKLATMMQMPIPHANGAVGDFFSGLWNGAKELEDIAEDALKNVVGFGKSLFGHFIASVTPKSTDKLNSGLKLNLPGFYADHLKNWLKKQLDDIHSADSPAGTMPKEAFAKAARQAAQSLGQSISSGDIDHLYWQAFTESSVNPAQNGGYDDHDGTGLPIGLFQFKRSTWNAAVRAMGGKHNNIHSAVDQIAAVLADRAWRSDFPPIGVKRGWSPSGYANGGIATEPSIFGEAGAEMAIPLDTMKSTRAWQLLRQVVNYYSGGQTTNNTKNTLVDLSKVEKKFDTVLAQNAALINAIERLIGVTDSANNPTARYRKTQRDINLAQAQSLTGM